jgi:UDP-N-acetylmuramoyl-tripeptide--D-alanyl-D-alanine ligase
MVWTGQEIMTATAAAAPAAAVAATRFEAVCPDSRRVGRGALFIALRGAHYDGHEFAAAALRAGAAAVVLERLPPDVDARRAFVVRDTLRALGDLAAYTRQRWGGRVAAITGSNGKTTTKEMVAAICARAGFAGSQRGVLKTHANENNLVGLPLTLLRLAGDEAVAALELGMNAPGEIARLTEIADPDVGCITNVGPAHLEGLGTVAGVAAAKGELFAGMRRDAAIAVNMDDEWAVRVAAGFAGRRIEFGRGGEVTASGVAAQGVDGIAFTLHVGAARAPVALRLAGRHNVQNALAAAAVAHAFAIGLDAIAAGLEATEPPKMRLQVVRLANGVTIVNDAYNANPASAEAALDAISSAPGRSIAVLGEMRELGATSAELHRRLGAHAAGCGVGWLLAVGPQAEEIAAGARAADPALEITVCNDAASAAALLIARWQPGDTILVKGSRGADTEAGVRQYGARMAEVAARLEAAGGRA